MRLAGASILPFSFVESAETIGTYLDEIEADHKKIEGAPKLDFPGLRHALDTYRTAADQYDKAIQTALKGNSRETSNLKPINTLLYKTERAFGYNEGLPKRDWYKHQIYAPGLDTGYGVKTIPGVREGIDRRNWDETRRMVTVVIGVLNTVAKQVEEATGMLKQVGGK
jgi:N-acetylated-alpha-linked acidic dipeptidase